MTNLQSSPPSEPIPLGKIEQELTSRLSTGKPTNEAVRWARMSNLVIFCSGENQAQSINIALPSIVAHHPARVLMLIADSARSDQTSVTGTVNVFSCADNGDQGGIFSEQVTLRAVGSEVDNLPYAVRGLLIGDLPTNLWWASPLPPPLAGPLLFDLAECAQQVIYDSMGWPDPARGLLATSAWVSQFQMSEHGIWRVASDLNWRRLKYWRRLLAQALDPASVPGALTSVTQVLVEHGPHAVVQAWQLVSWLASRLGWHVSSGKLDPGIMAEWHITAPHGRLTIRLQEIVDGPSEVRRVRITCKLAGKPDALNFQAEDGQRLAAKPEGSAAAARTVTLQSQTLPELIGRQLSDRECDPVFVDSMRVARELAKSVLN